MDIELLKNALNDPENSQESTANARSAAVSARQETRETLSRMDERVQLDIAKAAGTTVELGDSDDTPIGPIGR
jgi:hypothetical protein